MLPLQGKRPQDAGVQLCAPLQQHPPHHLEAVPYHQGQPVQMVVPGNHQGQALPAAYQAITMPDTAVLIDVQGSCTYCGCWSAGFSCTLSYPYISPVWHNRCRLKKQLIR